MSFKMQLELFEISEGQSLSLVFTHTNIPLDGGTNDNKTGESARFSVNKALRFSDP